MSFAKVGVKQDDDECWSVFVKFTGTPRDSNEVQEYLNKIKFVYDSHNDFVLMYEAEDIGLVSPMVLAQQANFMREVDHLTSSRVRGCSINLANSFADKMLQTLFVMKPPACPLKVFTKDKEAAKEYLRTMKKIPREKKS